MTYAYDTKIRYTCSCSFKSIQCLKLFIYLRMTENFAKSTNQKTHSSVQIVGIFTLFHFACSFKNIYYQQEFCEFAFTTIVCYNANRTNEHSIQFSKIYKEVSLWILLSITNYLSYTNVLVLANFVYKNMKTTFQNFNSHSCTTFRHVNLLYSKICGFVKIAYMIDWT